MPRDSAPQVGESEGRGRRSRKDSEAGALRGRVSAGLAGLAGLAGDIIQPAGRGQTRRCSTCAASCPAGASRCSAGAMRSRSEKKTPPEGGMPRDRAPHSPPFGARGSKARGRAAPASASSATSAATSPAYAGPRPAAPGALSGPAAREPRKGSGRGATRVVPGQPAPPGPSNLYGLRRRGLGDYARTGRRQVTPLVLQTDRAAYHRRLQGKKAIMVRCQNGQVQIKIVRLPGSGAVKIERRAPSSHARPTSGVRRAREAGPRRSLG